MLNMDQQNKLKIMATKILADYDLRYFKYVCAHINLDLVSAFEDKIKNFFGEVADISVRKEDLYWISESMFFPMQGLVRKK